ncbi:MAG TPA: hypothetical protein VI729_04060, partial [Anaerolineales bacterium]|nr:hypothetical protein [Anaerolineales bacterium]
MALIPPFFLDCVVAIGRPADSGGRAWIASGFIYGHYVEMGEGASKKYRLFLVTNRHVFENLPTACLRFNKTEGQDAFEFDLTTTDPQGNPIWLAHPNSEIDIAIIGVN